MNKNNLKPDDTKKIVLLVLHILAPLIIALILLILEIDGMSSFKNAIFFGFLFSIGGIIAANTAGFNVKSKTGRSFETKSGMVLDEYETNYVDTSIKSNRNHMRILFFHILFLIMMFYLKGCEYWWKKPLEKNIEIENKN